MLAQFGAKLRLSRFKAGFEALAQVASQTLTNLTTIDQAASVPVLRPNGIQRAPDLRMVGLPVGRDALGNLALTNALDLVFGTK